MYKIPPFITKAHSIQKEAFAISLLSFDPPPSYYIKPLGLV